ncbi:MAG TPA: hypothetical protein VMV77_08845 [Bacteroidales bacterium]|nr:hypothetical protein [Bacteroidales bacterium]
MPTGKEVFQKYLNNIFIETGALVGDGIQHALDAGFKTVFSIELSKTLYNRCVDRFKNCDNVHLIHGDSSKVLGDLLTMIKEPTTFWLDAHESKPVEKNKSPLISELRIISNHPIKTHTILIDDIRCFGMFGFDIEIIKSEILKINKDYKFSYEYGFQADDILTATI